MSMIFKPGDILSKDIRTDKGILLIPHGTRLTVDMVSKLKKFSINEMGIASERPPVGLNPMSDHNISAQFANNDAKLTKIAEKVESVKQIFADNMNPKEIETIAYDTASDIVEEIVELDGETNICINDLRTSDEYTYQHSVDVSILATMLGKNIGLPKKYLSELAQAGLLHDIGKQRIPKEILNKPTRLTDDEIVIMRTHSILGYEIATKMQHISNDVKRAILQHHEKIDGSGYPYAVDPSELGLYERIISIADIYDALTHKRCYKPPLTSVEAFGIMTDEISAFDRNIFVEFFKHITFYPLNSKVILTDGSVWTIVDNKNARLPKVMDEYGRVLDLTTSNLKVYGVYSDAMMAKWQSFHA